MKSTSCFLGPGSVGRRALALAALLLLPLVLSPLVLWPGIDAQAQDNPDVEKSRFVRFVEEQLSAPGREIRIGRINGVLSSEATISEITISDATGVWLTITGAEIVWSRAALFRGRLDVDRLAATRIEVSRQPRPSETAPSPEARGFALPELPLAILLDEIEAGEVVFGPTVFGLASTVSLTGAMRLEDGTLETALAVERTDGPGGSLELTASYANSDVGVVINLATGTGANGDAQGDVLSQIEFVVGSDQTDQLSGDFRDNRLDGGIGFDSLFGAAGSDTLIGGEGDDTL
ncbi:MAG: hypothetical protein AAF638_06490, partial [Pseudomonadota bacterium]